MAKFHFSGKIDKRIAMPYAAVLYLDDNRRLCRRFLELTKKKTVTDAESVITEGNFTAEEGDIVEVKKGDMDVKWYLVRDGKLEERVDIYYTKTKDYASSKMLDTLNYLEKNQRLKNKGGNFLWQE
jgi:hypothetical protein